MTRTFKDRGQMAAYVRFTRDRPDPEKTRATGGLGHAYWSGRTYPRGVGSPPRPPFIRSSLAYAAWAAGVDVAREIGADQ